MRARLGRRRSAAVLVAALGALTALVPAGAGAREGTPSTPTAPPPEATPAATSLARCASEADRLLVLLLVDESGSLDETDPGDARVPGVRAALAGLARLADEQPDGRSFTVEVRVATFAEAYRGLWDGWRTLGPESLNGMLADADTLGDRDGGLDTDYATALTEARKDLADRAAAVGGDAESTCKALLFFTDGRFDIGDRAEGRRAGLPHTVPWADVRLDQPGGGARAVEAGRDYLCRPGGLGDQLVADGVITWTVALDTQMAPDARNFLDRLTDGQAPDGSRCGQDRTVADGEYLSVGQAEQLVFQFASLFAVPLEIQFCPRPDAGPCTFDVAEGTTGFLLTTAAPIDGVGIVLQPPSGGEVRLPGGSSQAVQVGGAELAVRPFSGRDTEVEATVTDERQGWAGTWTLEFTAPQNARLSEPVLYTLGLRADLVPELVSEPTVVTGAHEELELALAGPNGRLAAGNPLAASAEIDATIVEPDGDETALDVEPQGQGRFTAEYEVPDDLEAGEVDLVLEPVLDPLEGVTVSARPTSVTLEVRLPPDYPVVGELKMSPVTGEGTSRGSLAVEAGERSGGTVCVGAARVTLPEGAGGTVAPDVEVPGASDDGCLRLQAGESGRIDVAVDVRHQATGRAHGELALQVTSDAAGEPRTLTREADFDMRIAPNGGFAALVFVLLMVAGLGLPLLFVHLMNVLAGRLARPNEIRSRDFAVTVDHNGLRGQNGDELDVRFEDAEIARAGEHPGRSLFLEGGVTVWRRASGKRGERWSLLTGPYAVADAGPRSTVLAGTEDRSWARFAKVGRHEVPLGVAGTWIFVVERWGTVATPTTGTLVVVIPNGEVTDDPHGSARRVLAAAREQLPDLLRLVEIDRAASAAERADRGPRRGWRRRKPRDRDDNDNPPRELPQATTKANPSQPEIRLP